MAEKIISRSIYVLLDDDTAVLPSVELKFAKLDELPENGFYHVITKEGIFHAKDTPLIQSTTEVPDVPGLGEMDAKVKLRMPKLPTLITAKALQFFRQVFQDYKAEAEVMLLYNSKKREYSLWCPEQEVTAGGVDYEMKQALIDTPEDWTWVGTIHSHCDFGAFHSSTDTHDEKNEDGVHITIGHVASRYCSMCSSIVVNNNRWQTPPENICLGVERRNEAVHRSKSMWASQSEYFEIVMSPEEHKEFKQVILPQINDQWMPRVQPGSYFFKKKKKKKYRGKKGAKAADFDESLFSEEQRKLEKD